MDKKICAFIFTITFISLSGLVHSTPEHAHREPAVNQIVEIDIEDIKNSEVNKDSGFDFSLTQRNPAALKSRIPANIISKSEASSTSSYIGPIIFLIALPFGLWIMVSRKFSKPSGEESTVGYFPKNHQFNPNKTDYQNTSEDDDDLDFPKAS